MTVDDDCREPTYQLRAEALATGEDIDACLELATRWGARIPIPGDGATAERWALLAATADGDVTVARVLEPHLDALAILAEAAACGELPDAFTEMPGVWGVFAAEAPGTSLRALRAPAGWSVTGTKPWCSLASRLDHALVTAHTAAGRSLFAVDLRQPGVRVGSGNWVARGLRCVDSGPVDFDATPCRPVGSAGWYLRRPGFAWGAIGVAACWYGGARGLIRSLAEGLHRRAEVDRVLALHLGRADAALFAAGACLTASAHDIDSTAEDPQDGALLAARVRAVTVGAVETVLREVGHALGPGPLAFEEAYARRVADLELYIRQHHGERDLAELGSLSMPWWISCEGTLPPGPNLAIPAVIPG